MLRSCLVPSLLRKKVSINPVIFSSTRLFHANSCTWPRRLVRTESRWRDTPRPFCSAPKEKDVKEGAKSEDPKKSEGEEKKLTEEEREKLREQAEASDRLWNMLIPERNIGVTHPIFLVMLALVIVLRLYNNHNDEKENEKAKALRLLRKARREGGGLSYFSSEETCESLEDETRGNE